MSKRKKKRARLSKQNHKNKQNNKNITTIDNAKKKEIEKIVEETKKELSEEETEIKTEQKKKFDPYYIILICLVIASFVCNTFFFQLALVSGASMSPTMEDGQLLIISKVAKIEEYERGDIIIFQHHGRKLIKRLIGFPGETIQIVQNNIYINGEKLSDYVDIEMDDYGIFEAPYKIPDGEYVFLGDNRNNSSDSRAFGSVKTEDIIGKIIFRFWPLDTEW